MFNSRDAPRHASHQASSHGAKWCAGHSRFWPADLAARTIGEPGVIGARLEPDGSSEASHLDSPRALLYLWEWIRRYGGRFETEPSCYGRWSSVHSSSSRFQAVLRLPPRPFSFGWRVRLLPLSSLCLSRSPSRTPDTGSGFGDRSEGNRGSLPNERLPGLLPLSVLPAGDGNHPLASSCLS